ncbi:TATA box-binding protein-associated factor RNA polymerase I subunit A [Myripristis murdjan]|uniref:TATA box binding protein (TBP)-associated factor, RNA polymerase I, A n=1 Tax=Myripristis murdjan TaxID=586833 RepID=A0A668AJT9_9TELE|nr:TATA box-binding protein-associated factor RNA polymerase I subunit A [Myripristis murdjan]XP_029903632.1 TATA box-binding protein-associated factor RNA polymerase I subunit A [Myripristis murdjan]
MDDLEAEQSPPQESDEDEPSDSNTQNGAQLSKLPLADPIFQETIKESGFHRTTRICLEQIREAMLHHRWQEAAEYMSSCYQMLEDTKGGSLQRIREIIWRISTEILHHHPNSKMEDYNNIYERMKHSGVKHYLMICLEHSFHLLVNGQIEDAKRQLSIAESWKYGKLFAGQSQRSKLIQAYRSLLEYFIWCDKKFTHSLTDNPDDGATEEMHRYFRHSAVNLKDILTNPGIWDPFILSYVDMLEFYEDNEEALRVLNDYAYNSSFPLNPNAHVFLYQYLKRHEAPQSKLMKVLKGLYALVPSHELMLEYCSLLLQSEKEDNIQKALGVILDMLDYTCWKTNLEVWKCLKTIIDKLKLQNAGNWSDIISGKMEARKDWWPALHFTSFHARKDSEENPELVEMKASLTSVLFPDQTLNYTAEEVISGERT